MDVNLRNVKSGIVAKISVLEIKVLKKISDDHYIVADETDQMLFESEQNLKEESCYKLIKPVYKANKLTKNSKFAAVKLQKKLNTTVLKQPDVKSFLDKLETVQGKEESKIETHFESIEDLGVGGIVKEITLIVTNKSSVIAGKFGQYRIVTCKDIKNQKNSVNLYRNCLNMVDVGEIYKFTNLKVSNFKKEDEKYHRTGTTYSSRITKASAVDEKEFTKMGVMLGDEAAKGTIVGISELKVYESCEECWCKVDDEYMCWKCNKKVDKKKKDFNLCLYIEIEKQDDQSEEEEILNVFSFKSTLGLADIEKLDVTEDSLNTLMMGKKCDIQYNREKQMEDDKCRLVKFVMTSS